MLERGTTSARSGEVKPNVSLSWLESEGRAASSASREEYCLKISNPLSQEIETRKDPRVFRQTLLFEASLSQCGTCQDSNTWLCVYRDERGDSRLCCISLHVTQRRSGTGPRVAPVETVIAPKLLLATAAISISGSIWSACGSRLAKMHPWLLFFVWEGVTCDKILFCPTGLVLKLLCQGKRHRKEGTAMAQCWTRKGDFC